MDPHDNSKYTPMSIIKYCFVPACKNTSKNFHKSFFTVPNSAKQIWCDAVGVTCPKRNVLICEDHLDLKEDIENYQYWKTMKGCRAKLKTRLPQSLIGTEKQDIDEPKPSTSSTPFADSTPYSQTTPQVDTTLYSQMTSKSHKGVQVKPKTSNRTTHCVIFKRKIKKSAYKQNPNMTEDSTSIEEALPSTQGYTTSDISEVSSEVFVKSKTQGRTFMIDLIQRKPQVYLGLPKQYYWLISYLETNMHVKSFNIIITLFKIKNNTPFYQISDMFEVSPTTLWRTFFSTLLILSKFFKQFIYSPSIFDVKRNLPSTFTSNKEYANVFCIIDCFEIEIEKPSNPVTQSLTWSQYKNCNTLKYLLATTPDGFINFVSAGFGGRTSDANIVENSGFLDVLPPNCTILADRGFKHIETLLNKKQIKLLRPPSVSKDQKMTKQEAIKSKVIASLRIHVERVIRRVRIFKFLKPHSVINNKLINHADDVVIVACGLINIHNSIIKDD